jgi:hypothetical protein
MHGGHQVAQKFSTTGLPRSWLRATVRCESVMVKSGAVLPMRGGCEPLLQPVSRNRLMTKAENEKRFTLL